MLWGQAGTHHPASRSEPPSRSQLLLQRLTSDGLGQGPQPLSAACAASKLSPPRFSPFTHQRPFWVMAFPFPKPLGPPPAAFHRSTVSGGAHEALHGGSQRAGEVPASCWGTPPVASLLPFRAVTCSSPGPSLWGSFSDHLCVHSSGGLVHKSAC